MKDNIPVVILCGGAGTRLSEYTEILPKPLVEIGGKPILWHIMKHYSHYGFNEFYLALGYKGTLIKKYFLDFYNNYPAPEQFLTNERWFNLLAGNDDLLRDIRAGKSEDEIADSWRAGLDAYKSIRRNYLLYPDFE